MSNSFIDPPLGLYVHIPWCVRKCPYCDFNSHESKGELPEAEYIQALLQDLEQEAEFVTDRTIDTVFIGGGTPSLFAPESIARLLTGVAQQIHLAPDVEITLEANPGTLESGRLREFVSAGVNRISVGVQSFNNDMLQRIGRIHDAHASVQAVEAALNSGARSVNLDLMYSLPEQDVDQAQNDLHTALKLGPAHISWYQLTLEPNTLFYRHPPALPDVDLAWEIHEAGLRLLTQSGYQRYEISAFAQGGAEARHNLNYWRFGDYLGIGAGAHGKLSHGSTGTISRSIKFRHPRQYLDASKSKQGHTDLSRTTVESKDRVFEFMLNALRLVDGFEPTLFQERTGISLNLITSELNQAQNDGLLVIEPSRIRASEFGLRFLNDLTARFLSPAG